ncbi:MAG: YqgE/AlgH family protein [Patescibacteria group bacterium]|nr:YqgE/AlgH family protein [Patescibacteria group bacterium]
MESLEGHLLIASPELLDPNFARSVVLMVQHNEQGALGLVLNRPTNKELRHLWADVSQEPCNGSGLVYLGGPVPGPIMAVHGEADLGELEVLDGVFFAARKDHLDSLVLRTDLPYKVFVGHSGWGPGQLEGELKLGGWLTAAATVKDVFHDGDDLWARLVKGVRHPLPEMLNIKRVPPDPSLN